MPPHLVSDSLTFHITCLTALQVSPGLRCASLCPRTAFAWRLVCQTYIPMLSPYIVSFRHLGIRKHVQVRRPTCIAFVLVSHNPLDALLSPLLAHHTHPTETHYYPLMPSFHRPILLHSHAAAPFISTNHTRGMKLVVYSGECQVTSITISIDAWGTIGRWGYRYAPAAVSWATGAVAVTLFNWWTIIERSNGA